MHVDIVVEDIEAEVHRLQALGVRRIDEDVQSFGGTRSIFLGGAAGNRTRFSTWAFAV